MDKSSHLVTLEDIEITRVSFPSAPAQKDTYLALLKKHSPSLVKTIALDRLQASLSITQAEEKHAAPEFKNNAPEILYRQNPAILVLIDGTPALRETGTKDYLRVINTRSLLVLNQASGTYFLYLGDRWMSAKDWKGPWSSAANPPAALEPIKKAAAEQNQADLLNEPGSPLLEDLQKGVVPEILVSTKPAELIQTSGKPQLQPISGTKLLYVNNSSDSIFVDEADQNYYILLSGRWYRASALDGKWSYVASQSLPADFAKIPENHPKGEVLTSVAHTKQAQEAAISNEIPQTATVDRNQANLNVSYDGPPDFKPVEGTPLRYAPNSPTPVIEVDAHSYYAVQNGIWFEATSATGPWVVATRVPSVIYSIPPSSPLYYVTFVKVYGSTPEVVYVGYTPGYLGSYVNADGVVIFGTGYPYSPWIGSYWYGAPVTFGFGLFGGLGSDGASTADFTAATSRAPLITRGGDRGAEEWWCVISI